jgi:hypothetical protein
VRVREGRVKINLPPLNLCGTLLGGPRARSRRAKKHGPRFLSGPPPPPYVLQSIPQTNASDLLEAYYIDKLRFVTFFEKYFQNPFTPALLAT